MLLGATSIRLKRRHREQTASKFASLGWNKCRLMKEQRIAGPKDDSWRSGFFATVLCSLLAPFVLAMSIAEATPAASPDAQHQISFDISAQSLVSALEVYGAISGRQVVYDASLAEGRQSTGVKGVLPPDVALHKLLAGTGLAPRYMAADGFVLVPDRDVDQPRMGTQSQEAVTRYYGRVQARLKQILCADKLTRLGGYRAVIGLWIASSGIVTRAVLLDTTGNSNLDSVLDRMVSRLVIGEPPPAGFAQPLVMLVVPDRTRDCQNVLHYVERAKADP